MKISEYLSADCCVMSLKSEHKDDVIREIAAVMAKTGKIKDQRGFSEAILEREALGSTGIGHNVAIPHSRTDTVDGFIIGFGRAQNGIDFNALDGEKVNLVFLMGANPSELNLYLRLLAELSKLLMQESFRRALVTAVTPQDVTEIFKKFESGR